MEGARRAVADVGELDTAPLKEGRDRDVDAHHRQYRAADKAWRVGRRTVHEHGSRVGADSTDGRVADITDLHCHQGYLLKSYTCSKHLC